MPRFPGANEKYRADAIQFCFEPGDTEKPFHHTVIEAQPEGAKCPCRIGPRYCELFPPAVCPDGQKLTFQSQLNCSWIGHSRENYADGVLYNGMYDSRLLPADGATSFIDWLYDRWGVNAYTWEKTFWACCGNFAVTSDIVAERPLRVWRRAYHEMTHKGIAGGIAGMYFERSWRSIFAIPPEKPGAAGAGGAAGGAGRRRRLLAGEHAEHRGGGTGMRRGGGGGDDALLYRGS